MQPQLEIDYSYSFLTSFVELVQKAKNLNHLDLSGMGWTLEPLVKISHTLVTCPNLASVHMCDNGLYGNLESKLTVLDIFGIDQDEMENNSRTHLKNKSVSHASWMRKTVAKNVKKAPTMLGDVDYQTKILKSKEAKSIAHSKVVN